MNNFSTYIINLFLNAFLWVLDRIFEITRKEIRPEYPYSKETREIQLPIKVGREIYLIAKQKGKIKAVMKVTALTGAELRISKDYVENLLKSESRSTPIVFVGLFTGLLITLGILLWQLPKISSYVTLGVLLWQLPKISPYGLGTSIFIVYVLVSLLAGGITFGIFRSYAAIKEKKKFRLAVELGGAIAIWLSVLFAGMYFAGKESNVFEITILKLAEQGDADTQFNLGMMYGEGQNIRKDVEQAIKWLCKAGNQGHNKAKNHLKEVYSKDLSTCPSKEGVLKEAPMWELLKLAQRDDANAQFDLGVMYGEGQSIQKDVEQAIEWLCKAGNQGHNEAKSYLKEIYSKELSTCPSEESAKRKLLLKAQACLAENPPVVHTSGKVFQDTLQDDSKGPIMVTIPGGNFCMGSIQESGWKSEFPVHAVSVKSFAIGIYEVTFDEYDRFADATGRKKPSDSGWGRRNRPVINVSWHDATAYAEWLSGQTREQYHLPTEAEWEYAARAGTETGYFFGNNKDLLGKYDWYYVNSGGKTHPAGKKQPNAWGLYDVHGNVWEWVQDRYGYKYYAESSKENPSGPESGAIQVIRGGSWNDPPRIVRSARRHGGAPGYRCSFLGFRLVRSYP